MTIFRSELIDPSALTFQYVSSNEPDLIGIEVMLDGRLVLDVSMNREGLTSALIAAEGKPLEFDLGSLQSVLGTCEAELNAWRKRLQEPAQIWAPA